MGLEINRRTVVATVSMRLGYLIVLAALVAPASAAVIPFTPAPGSTVGGQPVSARVSFTTAANQVDVFLENLQADPTSAVQCLSGLKFTLSTGQTAGTITTSSGTERSVNNNNPGGFTDGAVVATGWGISSTGTQIWLDRLSQQDANKNTIIGPPDGSNAYASGNPSIAGGSHNPHLGLNASFTLNVPGVTASSFVTSVTFQFNTAYGFELTVPEPGMASVLGIAGLACLVVRRRGRGG
jgi:hypothetical protein